MQGFPFHVTKETPRSETIETLNEYYQMKAHPEKYRKYNNFKELMDEVLADA